MGWDAVSRATGREVAPGFMGDVLQSARADGALWLLVIAFCVAAPVTEELFSRGFLYRGWSESFLGVPGAILLSSLVWTALHLQYDWFFFGEVFSIGLLLGYLRYRFNSTWLTIFVHGLNNLAAVVQTIMLAGSELGPSASARLAQISQPVQRALQDEDRGVFVDHLRAAGAAHVHADQFALDRGGGQPLVPQRDGEIGEFGKIAGEGAGGLRARSLAGVHVDGQAEHEADGVALARRWRSGARHRP